MSGAAVRLQPVTLQFRRVPGPLLAQIEAALAPHGQPLRWALTAVEPGLDGSCPLLTLEAVVLA
ncbi:MAG: hypothetical protein O2839_01995 [Cyanobacteria bacterium]|nr:hypothetical protein [Cyanobacteriota bacterium]MDA1246431.1 hypothetical protein [Cyanobacteriota bacterium]